MDGPRRTPLKTEVLWLVVVLLWGSVGAAAVALYVIHRTLLAGAGC